MTKIDLRRRALELRKERNSYSQIKSKLGISKSTLSNWLRNYPLTVDEINALRGRSEIRIEKYRKTMQAKREQRLLSYYDEEKKKWLPLTDRELFLAGLFLYWGEGNKSQRNIVSINNTDPSVVKFSFFWLKDVLGIPRRKITVFLHLYNDMNINEEILFWSKQLHQPIKYFSMPYIKKSTRALIDQKGFGHGTCGVRVNNTILKEHIVMALKAIADYYEAKI